MGRSENKFSEGVALGVLMCDRDHVPQDKTVFEAAFSAAWRRWPFASRFPFVGAVTKADEIYQMTHAGKNHETTHLYWDGHYIQARGGIDEPLHATEIADSIDPDIPASAWRNLMETAFEFYKEFKSNSAT